MDKVYYRCGTCGRLYGGHGDVAGIRDDALHCCARLPVFVPPEDVVPCGSCHGSGRGEALFADCGECHGVGGLQFEGSTGGAG